MFLVRLDTITTRAPSVVLLDALSRPRAGDALRERMFASDSGDLDRIIPAKKSAFGESDEFGREW